MRLTAKTFDFEIKIASIQRIAQRWRRLGRSAIAQHTLVPSLTGEPIGFLPRFGRALR
jgi:hypothetical protein